MSNTIGIQDVRIVGGVITDHSERGDYQLKVTFKNGFEAIILIPDDLEEVAGTSPDCIGLNLVTLGHYS